MKTWEPEHIFEKADYSSSRKVGQNKPEKVLDRSLSALLDKEALRSPENTLRFLRRWYWEKWPPAEGSGSAISSISPQDRLAVVFEMLDRETLGYFFRMMSPVERSNFSEIMSRQSSLKHDTVQRICQEFLEGLKIRH